jgi:hypothetical protein
LGRENANASSLALGLQVYPANFKNQWNDPGIRLGRCAAD